MLSAKCPMPSAESSATERSFPAKGPFAFLFTCMLACLLPRTAWAVEVRLQVAETDKVARTPAIITTGVPFPRGQVKDVGRLAAAVAGKPVPAQFITTAPWDDGSVRWALMDVQVALPADGKVELVVSDGGGNPAPAAPVKITDTADAVAVSTGALQFTVSKKKGNLFESVKVDGKELITSAGKGLVVLKVDGSEALAGPPAEVKIEQAGPMRAIVCVKGKFPGVHNDLLGYTARISAFAGSRTVKVHVWLENGGAYGWTYGGAKDPAPEWFAFRGMAVDFGLGLGEKVTAKCEGAESTDGLKVLQTCRPFAPRADKRTPPRPYYTWDDFDYTITGKAAGGQPGKELKKGARTDGVVELRGETGTLTAAIRHFWQNYEKAVEQDGQSLRLWLWPTEGRWPRLRPDQREAELGQALGRADWTGAKLGAFYYLPGGVHKGHEFILDFSGRDARETAAELSAPLMAMATAEYYASTEAAPGLFAPPDARTGNAECDGKLGAWLRMTRSLADPENPAGLVKARQSSEAFNVGYSQDFSLWHGWMDFGDLSVPGHGQVSLHYDWLWVVTTGAMRTGDAGLLRLGCEMARHRIDIDQAWSDRDLPELGGLQHPDWNCPSYHCGSLRSVPGVGANWLAGLVGYYMLTGEPKALECCLRNAEGVRAGWRWVAKRRPYNGPQTDMADNAWSMSAYCAMHKLTGERKWLTDAVDLFNRHVAPKREELGPFLHDARHQIRQQDYIQEDMKYCYLLGALCELHHLTGDEKIFKLLQEGCEKVFPDTFFEAPVYLSDMYAYVGLKSAKAEYLKKAADLFAQGFSESKCPPVYLADSTTWSRAAVMTLRTGHVMQYATWKARNGK